MKAKEIFAAPMQSMSADARAPLAFQERPLWLDDVELPPSSESPFPTQVDVAIVGSGYTGLSAAGETAAAGRKTVVLDAGPIGGGCSSRNGGQVAFSFKPSLQSLSQRYGRDVAERLYMEGHESIRSLRAEALGGELDCGWKDVGSFYGALTSRQYESLQKYYDDLPERFRGRISIIPRKQLQEAISSPLYCGGVISHDDAAIHPAKLVIALHHRAEQAGAVCFAETAVQNIVKSGGHFLLRTGRGVVSAKQVLLATNGYSGAVSPWHRRRIIPIGSYIVATEPLDEALVQRLIPAGRNVGDMRRVVIYVRPSPDGRRIIFGGRASAGERNVRRVLSRMRVMMSELFPELQKVRISHAWMGFVGYTFDTMPHFGERDGVFHCMGYCGQGIPHSVYYGRKIGQKMVGGGNAGTVLEDLIFPTRPLYRGKPWLLPIAVTAYRFLDRLGI